MAGNAKPNENGLGKEVTIRMIGSSLNRGSMDGLIDGLCTNEWDTDRVAYWTKDSYVTFEIKEKSNMWRSGVANYPTYANPFIIMKDDGSGNFVDVTSQYQQDTTEIGHTEWNKFILGLDAGIYKFIGTGVRIDSEWYAECVALEKQIKLSINKTLKSNMPTSITPSEDEIHFTEDGSIYISKDDGTFMKCGGSNEASNIKVDNGNGLLTNVQDALEELRDRSTFVEHLYGDFGIENEILDADLPSDKRIIFDKTSATIPYQTTGDLAGCIKLKRGGVYQIDVNGAFDFTVPIGGHGFGVVKLGDESNHVLLRQFGGDYGDGLASSYTSLKASVLYTAKEDCYIYMSAPASLLVKVRKECTMSVTEIGRQVIIDPVESAKNIKSGIAILDIMNLNINEKKQVTSNASTLKDSIILERGKKYFLSYRIWSTGTKADGGARLMYGNDVIFKSLWFTDAKRETKDTVIVEPEDDMVFSLQFYETYGSSDMRLHMTMMVQEIATPVIIDSSVVNEVSNPLTTMPLEYLSAYGVANSVVVENPMGFTSSGNIDVKDNKFLLKKGVTYSMVLEASGVFESASSQMDISVFNDKTKQIITESRVTLIPATATYIYTAQAHSSHVFVTMEEDTYCYVAVEYNAKGKSVIFRTHIQEVRNTPVNQYGGFQTKVLFDGNANAVGEYDLLGNVVDYDYVVVEAGTPYEGDLFTHRKSEIIMVKSINHNNKSQHQYCIGYNDGSNKYLMNFNFGDKKIKISAFTCSVSFTTAGIYKITGVRGQIPTLLRGGTF